MTRARNYRSRIVGAYLVGTLALGLAACAPEPDLQPGTEAGHTDKDSQTVNPETSWGNQSVPETEAQTTLPESFPSASFALPDGATIINTGERGTGQWFVVLRAKDDAQAQEWWQSVISSSGFEANDEGETTEGGIVATLQNPSLSVQAMTIPQADGSVQLSYDLQDTGM